MREESCSTRTEPPPLLLSTFSKFPASDHNWNEDQSNLVDEHQRREEISNHQDDLNYKVEDFKGKAKVNGVVVGTVHPLSSFCCNKNLVHSHGENSSSILTQEIISSGVTLPSNAFHPECVLDTSLPANSVTSAPRGSPLSNLSPISEMNDCCSSNNGIPSVPAPVLAHVTPSLGKQRHSFMPPTPLQVDKEQPAKRSNSHLSSPTSVGHIVGNEMDTEPYAKEPPQNLPFPFSAAADASSSSCSSGSPVNPPSLPLQLPHHYDYNSEDTSNKTPGSCSAFHRSNTSAQFMDVSTGTGTYVHHAEAFSTLIPGDISLKKYSKKRKKQFTPEKDILKGTGKEAIAEEKSTSVPLGDEKAHSMKRVVKDESTIRAVANAKMEPQTGSNAPDTLPTLICHEALTEKGFKKNEKEKKRERRRQNRDTKSDREGMATPTEMNAVEADSRDILLSSSHSPQNTSFPRIDLQNMDKNEEEREGASHKNAPKIVEGEKNLSNRAMPVSTTPRNEEKIIPAPPEERKSFSIPLKARHPLQSAHGCHPPAATGETTKVESRQSDQQDNIRSNEENREVEKSSASAGHAAPTTNTKDPPFLPQHSNTTAAHTTLDTSLAREKDAHHPRSFHQGPLPFDRNSRHYNHHHRPSHAHRHHRRKAEPKGIDAGSQRKETPPGGVVPPSTSVSLSLSPPYTPSPPLEGVCRVVKTSEKMATTEKNNTSAKSPKESANEWQNASTLLPISSTTSHPHVKNTERKCSSPLPFISNSHVGAAAGRALSFSSKWESIPTSPPPPPPFDTTSSPPVISVNEEVKWKELKTAEDKNGRKERNTKGEHTKERTTIDSPDLNRKVDEGNIFGVFFSSLARGSPASAVRSLQRNESLPMKQMPKHLSTSENLCCSWEDFSVILDGTEMRGNGGEEQQNEGEEKTEGKEDSRQKRSKKRGKPRKSKKEGRSIHRQTKHNSPYPTAKRKKQKVGLPTFLSVEMRSTSPEKAWRDSMNEKENEEVKVSHAHHRQRPFPKTQSTMEKSPLPSSKSNNLEEKVKVPREIFHSSTAYDISAYSSSRDDASFTLQSTSTFSSRSLNDEHQEKKPRKDGGRSTSISCGSDSKKQLSSFSSTPWSTSSFSFTSSSRFSSSSSRGSFASGFSSSFSTSSASSLLSGTLDRCIPLKEGCSSPLPSRYFVDFAFRLSHPQSLLPYSEEGHIYEWDLQKGEWNQTLTRVVLSVEPFAHGNMRSSYYLIDLSRPLCRLTAKRYVRHPAPREQYFDDVSMHSVAGHWARLYNSLLPPKLVKFIPAAVLELPHRRPPLTLAMEPLLTGTFNKYNNNCGFLPKKIRWTPQAFSHFTYVGSHHELMVVDIQGVSDIYTDPQILSPDGEGYGMGNLGMKGIQRFFNSHVCNPICHQLGLSKKSLVGINKRKFPLLPYGSLGPYRTDQGDSTQKSGGILPAQEHDALSQHGKQTNSSNFLLQSAKNQKPSKFYIGGSKDVGGLSYNERPVLSPRVPIPIVPAVSTPLTEYPCTAVEVAAVFSESLPPKASNLHHSSSARSTKNDSSASRSGEHIPSVSFPSNSALTKAEVLSTGCDVHIPHPPARCENEYHGPHLEPVPPRITKEGRKNESLIPSAPGAFIRPTPPTSPHASHRALFMLAHKENTEKGGDVPHQTNDGVKVVRSTPRYASPSPRSPQGCSAQHFIRGYYSVEGPTNKNAVSERSGKSLPKNEAYALRLRQHLVRQGHTITDGNDAAETSLEIFSSRYKRSYVGYDTRREKTSALSSSEAKHSWRWSRNKPLVQGSRIVSDAESEMEENGVLSSARSSRHKDSKKERSYALVATERVPPSR